MVHCRGKWQNECGWFKGNFGYRARLCHYSLSACCGVLRNLICAAIQVNIYPHKSSNSLTQWPATGGASIVLFNGAGFLLKLPLQYMGILVSITYGVARFCPICRGGVGPP